MDSSNGKIFVETTAADLGFGGIKRVVRNIASVLKAENDVEAIDMYRFVDHSRYSRANGIRKRFYRYRYLRHKLPNFLRKQKNEPITLFFPNGLAGGVSVRNVRTVFFINDLIPIRNPELYYFQRSAFYIRIMQAYRLYRARRLLRKSHRIICATRFWADYINSHVLKVKRDISVVPNMLDPLFYSSSCNINDSFAKKTERIMPFVLLNATGDIRKGDVTVIEALKDLSSTTELRLLMYGHNWKGVGHQTIHELVTANGLQDKAFHWGELSDDEVKFLYQRCVAFLYPSQVEGFGLPPLEFLSQSDRLVVLRDIPVFREVFGGYATFFSNRDELIEILGDLSSNSEVNSNKASFIAKHRSDRVAGELLHVLRA